MARIITPRKAGLDKRAPFWRGATAEKLVEERRVTREAEKLAKKLAKAGARKPRKERRTTPGVGPSMRTKTPEQQLRRLERSLTKRKTVAGRESVAARIRELTLLLEDA